MLRRSIFIQVTLITVFATTFAQCQDMKLEYNPEVGQSSLFEDSNDGAEYSRLRPLSDSPSLQKQSPVQFLGRFESGGSFEPSDKDEVNLSEPKAINSGHGFGQATEVKDLLANVPYRALNEQPEEEDKAFTQEDISNKEAVKLDETPYDFKSSSITNLPSFDSSISNKDAIPSGKLSYSPHGISDYSSFDDYSYDPSPSSDSESYVPSHFYDSSSYKTGSNENNQPQKQSTENCVDVDKEIDKRMMRCSVCTDIQGTQSENCAYTGQPKSYYNEKHYSSKSPDNGRQKRDQKSVINDPYEYIKSKNRYKSRPKEFDYSYYNPKEEETNNKDDDNYGFDAKDFVYEKSTSELEGEKLMKDGKNCQQHTKDGMTCTVCVNPEGGNFEQCSYAVEPKEQKYAYVKESKFDGNGKPVVKEKLATNDEQSPSQKSAASNLTPSNSPVERQKIAQTANSAYNLQQAPAPFSTKFQSAQLPRSSYSTQAAAFSRNNAEAESAPVPNKLVMANDPEAIIDQKHKELVDKGIGYGFVEKEKKDKDDIPYEAYESAREEERTSAEEDDGEEESQERQKAEGEEDDYHYKYFTDYKPDAQTVEKTVRPAQEGGEYFHTDESKKDVEKVFAEFMKKDRSNCKQVAKKGMTCYLCLDNQGIQNEECMYVSESQPKNTLMAYHEMQHANNKAEQGQATGAQVVSANPTTAPIVPIVTGIPAQLIQQPIPAASNVFETVVKYTPPGQPSKRSILKKSKTPKKYGDAALAASERDEEEAEEDSDENENDKERLDSSEKDDHELEEKQKLRRDANDAEPEFDINDEEGLFKEETKPVYSKALGYSLPRFMLERSEHEESYDEFVKGRRNRN